MSSPISTIIKSRERCLALTEEEAITLLETCLYAEEDDDPIRAQAITKLADLCREFLRHEEDTTATTPERLPETAGAAAPHSRQPIKHLLRQNLRREVAPA